MTLSDHFTMGIVTTYRKLIEAADIRLDEFSRGARFGWFDPDQSALAPANFAATCAVIAEILLPRHSAMASVHVYVAPHSGGAVRLRAGGTSSHAGRDYLDRLVADSTVALRLYDLFAEIAEALEIEVDLG